MGNKADRVVEMLVERQEASGKTDQQMAESFGWRNGKSWEHVRCGRVPVTRAFLSQVLATYHSLGHWVVEAIVELAIEHGAQVPETAERSR